MIRPRTTCIYCGRRIPGRDDSAATKSARLAARLTCWRHRRLPEVDPLWVLVFGVETKAW